MKTNLFFLALWMAILIAGCAGVPQKGETITPVPETPNLRAIEEAIRTQVIATLTAEAPTITPTPLPTQTFTPTHTPRPTQTPTRTPFPTATPDDSSNALEIVDWVWYTSPGGGYIYVDGLIKNISRRPMAFVKIHIALFDSQNRLLGTESGYIDADLLLPGQTATFKLMAIKPPNIEWVKIHHITWNWAD